MFLFLFHSFFIFPDNLKQTNKNTPNEATPCLSVGCSAQTCPANKQPPTPFTSSSLACNSSETQSHWNLERLRSNECGQSMPGLPAIVPLTNQT